MELTLKNLELCFKKAIESNDKFIAVSVTIPNCEKCEEIINPRENFECKLEYYKKAYNEDLTLKAFNQIKIKGFMSGNNYKTLGDTIKILTEL